MGEQDRWDKVRLLIEEAIVDENVRILYQQGTEEAILADLQARNIYPEDYNKIRDIDLPLLAPGIERGVFWLFRHDWEISE